MTPKTSYSRRRQDVTLHHRRSLAHDLWGKPLPEPNFATPRSSVPTSRARLRTAATRL